jgi:hypothetical protein
MRVQSFESTIKPNVFQEGMKNVEERINGIRMADMMNPK